MHQSDNNCAYSIDKNVPIEMESCAYNIQLAWYVEFIQRTVFLIEKRRDNLFV